MELSSNFTWGLIDESDFDHSSLIEHHDLEANDISFDVSKYVAKSKKSDDMENPHAVFDHDDDNGGVSTPDLSLPDSFDERENIKNINISPVRKQRLDGKGGKESGSLHPGKTTGGVSGAYYQPIIRHLKQALRKLVISEKAHELLKVKAAAANSELSLYEEACLRVMEFALPFKQDLESLRLSHQEALQVIKNLTQQSELAAIERQRQEKLHQCTVDAMQLEINTHLEANRRVSDQLARETDQCQSLAKTVQRVERDADLLKHRLAEQNEVLLKAKLEYQAVVDEKVERELGRLKESTGKEIAHMKLIASDVMERESRLHKEHSLTLQAEHAALRTQHTALQQQLAELAATHYSECKVLSTENSDLKAQLKMSLYENTILSASADAKNSGFQQTKIELEGVLEENRALKATLAQLEVQYHSNISELQTANRSHSAQLQQYAELEGCIDAGIMSAARSGADPLASGTPEMDSLNHLVSAMATGEGVAVAGGSSSSSSGRAVVSVAAYQKRLAHSILLAQDCLKHQSKCSTLKLEGESLAVENAALKKKNAELVADYRRCHDLPSYAIVNSLRGYESKYHGARAELTRLRELYEQLVRTHEDTDAQNQVLRRVQEQNKQEMEQVRQALLEMEIEQRLAQQSQSRRRYYSDSSSDSDSSSGYSSEDHRRSRRVSTPPQASSSSRSSNGSNRSRQSSVVGTPAPAPARTSPPSSEAQPRSSHPATPATAQKQKQSPPTPTAHKQPVAAAGSTPVRTSPPDAEPPKSPSPLLTPEKLGLSAAQFHALTSSQKASPDSKWHVREKTNVNS